MKRAQIQGQIFIYILAIVVVSLILMYGYRAVKGFNDQAKKVEILEFKTDLQNDIDSIRSNWGSVETVQVKVPSGFNEVCFVDLKYNDVIHDDYPLINDSINSGVKKNVFLIKTMAEESFYMGDIRISPAAKILCFDVVQGKARVTLSGKGDHTVILVPP